MTIEERKAIKELEKLEEQIKDLPKLTPEDIEDLKKKAHEQPEQKKLDAEIRQLKEVLRRLEAK